MDRTLSIKRDKRYGLVLPRSDTLFGRGQIQLRNALRTKRRRAKNKVSRAQRKINRGR